MASWFFCSFPECCYLQDKLRFLVHYLCSGVVNISELCYYIEIMKIGISKTILFIFLSLALGVFVFVSFYSFGAQAGRANLSSMFDLEYNFDGQIKKFKLKMLK